MSVLIIQVVDVGRPPISRPAKNDSTNGEFHRKFRRLVLDSEIPSHYLTATLALLPSEC